MLSVYSPLQIESTSSYPFHSEMRSSHSQTQQHSTQERDQEKQQQKHSSSPSPQQQAQEQQLPKEEQPSPRPSSYSSSTSTPSNSKSSTTSVEGSVVFAHDDPKDAHNYYKTMIPSQTQAVSYGGSFYSTDYGTMKPFNPHFGSSHYMSSYNRPTIHDRRQSMMAGQVKVPSTPPPPSSDVRSRQDYSAQGVHSTSAGEVSGVISATQHPAGAWDPAQQSAPPPVQTTSQDRGLDSYSAVQPNLPPLSEALHGLSSATSPPMAVSPPMQAQQTALSAMGDVVAPTSNFYASNTYLEMQAPVNVYPPQNQFDSDPSKVPPHGVADRHTMIPQDSSAAPNASYGRRVTYPFVSPLESGSGLVMTNMIPSDPAGSSPLTSNGPFAQSTIVGTSPVSVAGMPRTSPVVDYVDSLALQQQPHAPPSHHIHAQVPQPPTAGMHPGAWSQNGGEMIKTEPDANGNVYSFIKAETNGADSKVYSFVPLSGVNSKKRPRRRFDEIERLYVCNWGDCEKAYGTLNHLNAHVSMQKHGPKRLPAEFKELRKAWRKHKRAEEEAAKQAAAFHHQQTQNQQAQLQPPSLCDPVLAHMHPVHHPLAMHAISHHQPHQLPHPHAHPNQHSHPHHAHSQHHHPMGF